MASSFLMLSLCVHRRYRESIPKENWAASFSSIDESYTSGEANKTSGDLLIDRFTNKPHCPELENSFHFVFFFLRRCKEMISCDCGSRHSFIIDMTHSLGEHMLMLPSPWFRIAPAIIFRAVTIKLHIKLNLLWKWKLTWYERARPSHVGTSY